MILPFMYRLEDKPVSLCGTRFICGMSARGTSRGLRFLSGNQVIRFECGGLECFKVNKNKFHDSYGNNNGQYSAISS